MRDEIGAHYTFEADLFKIMPEFIAILSDRLTMLFLTHVVHVPDSNWFGYFLVWLNNRILQWWSSKNFLVDFIENFEHKFLMLAESWHQDVVDELSAPLILNIESLGITLASLSLINS